MPNMDGINASTGKRLGGLQHLRQSIRDILTTRIGTRVMRRAYGSRVMQLIDAPMNRSTLIDVYAAVAEALDAWEPRFRLTQVQAVAASPGRLELDLTGEYLPDGKTVTLDGIVVQ
jgi:phage baseplate assembly protein W